MANITVYLKNGQRIDYPHEGRVGGSYTKSIKYEGGFAIVTDEWGNSTAYPAEDIREVQTRPIRYG